MAIGIMLVAGSNPLLYAQELNAPKYLLDTDGELHSAAFSPNGKVLATISGTKTAIWLWDTATGKLISKLSTRTDPGNYVGESTFPLGMPRIGYTQLGFSPDGRFLAVFSQVTNDVRLWDLQMGKVYLTLKGIKYMMSVEFSPDGKLLALALAGQGLRLIDVYSGQPLTAKWDFKHVTSVTGVGFSKDGSTLVVGIASSKETGSGFYFADIVTGKINATITSSSSHDLYGNVSHDRDRLATFEEGGNEIKVWDMATGQLKNAISGSKSKIVDITFSYDGKSVAVMAKDGRIELWNIETSEPKAVLQNQSEKLLYAAFYPDDKTLLTFSTKGVKVWDAPTGTLKQPLANAREPFYFSPDGQLLVMANKKDGAQLWQLPR
jgi:WD40 repeat protein